METAVASPGLSGLFAALAGYRPGPDLRSEMIGLARCRDLLDLIVAQAAGELAGSQLWEEEGYTSPVAWLRYETRMASGVAADRVTVGLNLEKLSESLAALEDGEIGFAHLALMARSAELYRQGSFQEQPLLDKARQQTVTRFRKSCEHARHAQDPAGFAEAEAERHQQRGLELGPQDDGGLWLRGWLDPEGGSRLRSALEVLARPCGREDQRSRSQRLADALLEAVSGQQQTELVVTCSLATLEGRRGAPAAETEWGDLLSGKALERLACGAVFRRLVLDADSVVIDLGRRQRLLSVAARRALEARDQHCVWPGCERPARWCQSHHLKAWSEGGPTAVEASALLCRRHHRAVHQDGWRLLPEEGRGWTAIPPPPLPPTWFTDLPAA